MVDETKKILDQNISVVATCVRVPVFIGHSESVNIEFEKPFPIKDAYEILSNAPGLKLIDDFDSNRFPMPIDVAALDKIGDVQFKGDSIKMKEFAEV